MRPSDKVRRVIPLFWQSHRKAYKKQDITRILRVMRTHFGIFACHLYTKQQNYDNVRS